MSTQEHIVLMTLSPDRVGLVAQMTDFIKSRGGNIVDSRMAVLGSEFGLMVLVSGSAEQLARIETDAAALEASGMSVLVRRTRPPEATPSTCSVLVESMDHEGIVHAVAQAIQDMGANITSMETTVYHAPNTGSPLFRIEARLALQGATTLETVREQLGKVAERENLDLEVTAGEG